MSFWQKVKDFTIRPLIGRMCALSSRLRILSLRSRYLGDCPSIISCNCIGGVMCHDLGLPFKSPTVNLFLSSGDFLTFVENLEYYLSLEVVQDVSHPELTYPVGKVGDLTLYFMHYKTFEEARDKWNARRKRVDYQKIFVVAQDSEISREPYTPELMKRFQALPYEKVLFSYRDYSLPDCVQNNVLSAAYPPGSILLFRRSGYRYLDQFDWVNWLNRSQKVSWWRRFAKGIRLLFGKG